MKPRLVDPDWNNPERLARRARIRKEMLASVRGAQLAEIRNQLGITQEQLASASGLSPTQISQIENGIATPLETLRAYVHGLGGRLDVVARIGDIHLNVA